MPIPIIISRFNRHRLWILLPLIIGASLRIPRLGDYENSYYTATVASMLQSVPNFIFGSFDPIGVVMVDKPPASFWLQVPFAAVFGVSDWSVVLPQILLGIAAIAILYLLINSTYGLLSAVISGLVLAVLPASVVIDSRNEPDALVSFAALLAVACGFRAAQTGKYRWFLAVAVMLAIGFNSKMLVALMPVPALIIYFICISNRLTRAALLRIFICLMLFVILSLSWITMIALTPEINRPYVGSTPDNSIWTLLFKYNGLNRFDSFIGPRRQQPPVNGVQILPDVTGFSGYQPDMPAQRMIVPENPDRGILGLFDNRLSNQLGWLLPVSLFSLVVSILPILPESVYKRPKKVLNLLRKNPSMSQNLFWVIWLVTGLLIFGSANATTTHPYYLVGIAVPMAAVIGIGVVAMRRVLEGGTSATWIVVMILIACACYQLFNSLNHVPDWCISIVIICLVSSSTVVIVGLWKGLHNTTLVTYGGTLGLGTLLIIPLVFSVNSGGRIAIPSSNLGPVPSTPRSQNVAIPVGNQMRSFDRDIRLKEFFNREDKIRGPVTIITVRARDAAPFIKEGMQAIAIGGFSGNDPIFSLESFDSFTLRFRDTYFVAPINDPLRPMKRDNRPNDITQKITKTWKDVSSTAGLNPGLLYKKP